MADEFVHLHVHTEFSMLDGLSKIPKLLERAKADGQKAIAITDHGGMYGAIHFFNNCRKNEIKAIIGVEAYVAEHSRFDKQLKMGGDQYHMLLLAQDLEGYKNLMRLTSIANLEGFSYKPRIDDELLAQYNQGIIATTGCMASMVNRLLMKGDEDGALKKAQFYKELFPGRYYVELQVHQGVPELPELFKKQIELARRLDLPLVATNDVHYVHPDDAEAQDALLCVQTRKLISDKNRMTMLGSPDYYLRSAQEMNDLFRDYPEAVKNTLVIADQCNVEIETGKLHFPLFPLPQGETEESYFEKLAWAGLKKRYSTLTSELEDRLKYELEVIKTKGYSAYFLITQDFVNWAKNQGIGVGPGRGSAAGSLVAYSLGITSINPFDHGLPFERFLNPQRPTPPDIDMDFADDRRDEVIEYVASKYGSDHVAQIITFGKMEARVSVRDIGRVLGMPYEEPDKISKLIPNNPGQKTSLDTALNTVPELAEYYKQPKYKKLIDLAKKVEGVIRHNSVHAAAVVIADKPLTEYTPIQRDTKSGKTITQYDMYVLDCNVADDAIGLIKFDFLGLRNLSIIQTSLQLIKQYKNTELNLETLPLDDEKTFELLSSGETFGVFQLESAGMKRVARTLQPNQFSDITAMVALYRPGPMDLIPTFIEGKHNPDKIVYPHESLKAVLEETYGVMVYQEQILQIANVMAGYTLGEADILRRAIGKKKKYLLDENKKRFVSQSVEKGYKKEVAEKVWGFIEAFANYGFNKAHAASYAMISYQTAYLKAHYPVEYMAALMSVEASSHSANRDEKVSQAIETCKKMGIKVLPPDINKSNQDFTIEQDEHSLEGLAIRFGYSAIKNVGTAAISAIIETRERVGQFKSFTYFLRETDSRKVNKKVLECLIKVGAFDAFATRASMLENLEAIRTQATQFQAQDEEQDSLFAGTVSHVQDVTDNFAKLAEYPRQELLSFEKELLGLYLTEHPMARALSAVAKQANKQIADIDADIHNEHVFSFGGVITQMRVTRTKKSGKEMAFGIFQDETGSIEFVTFPKTYEEYGAQLRPDAVVLMKAKVSVSEGETKLMAEKISSPSELDLNHSASTAHRELFIPRKTSKDTLVELGTLLKASPGDESIVVVIQNGSAPKRMVLPYGVNWSDELEKKVQKLLE
jgi:DNA polymerase-3 subunit alpha